MLIERGELGLHHLVIFLTSVHDVECRVSHRIHFINQVTLLDLQVLKRQNIRPNIQKVLVAFGSFMGKSVDTLRFYIFGPVTITVGNRS